MVYLYDDRGVNIKAYLTDQEWNGVFAFFDLKPGTYTLRYKAYGYEEFSEKVVVKADQTTYTLPQLTPKP